MRAAVRFAIVLGTAGLAVIASQAAAMAATAIEYGLIAAML